MKHVKKLILFLFVMITELIGYIYIVIGNLNGIYFVAYLFYYKLRDIERAIRLIDKGLQKDHENIKLLYIKGDILYGKGHYDESAQYFNKILAHEEGDYDTKLATANIYYVRNDYNNAIIAYEELLKTFPEHDDCIIYLARAYMKMEEYEKAIFILKRIISNNEDVEAYKMLLEISEINKNKNKKPIQ